VTLPLPEISQSRQRPALPNCGNFPGTFAGLARIPIRLPMRAHRPPRRQSDAKMRSRHNGPYSARTYFAGSLKGRPTARARAHGPRRNTAVVRHKEMGRQTQGRCCYCCPRGSDQPWKSLRLVPALLRGTGQLGRRFQRVRHYRASRELPFPRDTRLGPPPVTIAREVAAPESASSVSQARGRLGLQRGPQLRAGVTEADAWAQSPAQLGAAASVAVLQ
jgi:hypothetical protein